MERRAPQTAIECFGRKLGHIGGHKGITGRESGSPDVTFPLEKVTFLTLARCGHEKMKERMEKVNGKPYLRTRIVIRATRQRALSLGKNDILDVGTMRA